MRAAFGRPPQLLSIGLAFYIQRQNIYLKYRTYDPECEQAWVFFGLVHVVGLQFHTACLPGCRTFAALAFALTSVVSNWHFPFTAAILSGSVSSVSHIIVTCLVEVTVAEYT